MALFYCKRLQTECAMQHRPLSREWTTVVMHHGDDFVIKVARGQTVKVKEVLEKGFMVKDRGILGSRSGECKTSRILNCTLSWMVAQKTGGPFYEEEYKWIS
eukprot:5430936-Amphidinium_carterae.2